MCEDLKKRGMDLDEGEQVDGKKMKGREGDQDGCRGNDVLDTSKANNDSHGYSHSSCYCRFEVIESVSNVHKVRIMKGDHIVTGR